MRIMLTVIAEDRHRDVVVEGDETATVAGLAAVVDGSSARYSNVVRLPRSRAPYDLDRARRERPSEATLWLDGRPLDPHAFVFGLLRDGDVVALNGREASATIAEEPEGMIELRVVGGPGSGSVHRLGLGNHTIGADPACAIAVPDPGIPSVAAVIRLTPSGVTVEPADRRPIADDLDDGAARRHAQNADMAERSDARTPPRTGPGTDAPAAARPSGGPLTSARAIPRLDGESLTGATPWPPHKLLACGRSAFSIGPVEPPDTHLDALPDGGLAYNRPPRLQRPERHRRIEVPTEPKRAEGIRPQLLAAFLPAVLGLVMALVFRQWYFLLVALMTPVIMIGQWLGDRRHGRKKHSQAIRDYRERLAVFETEVATARKEDEAARRHAAPDPAEVLLTATGPRRRLWERRIHDTDTLRLRVGLSDLPADLVLEPERGTTGESPQPEPPLSWDVPVALAMRRLGVAGVTGPREVALGCARWLVGQAAALHSPRDLAIVVLTANTDGAEAWGWVRWLPHCAADGVPRSASFSTDCVALVGADPEAAARRATELATLVGERLDADKPGMGGTGSMGATTGLGSAGGTGGTGGLYGAALRGARLSGGPTGWDDLGRPGSGQASEPAFGSYDERPCDVLVILDGAQVLRGLPGMPQVLRQGPRAGVYTIAIDDDQRLLPEECATVVSCGSDGSVRLRGGGLEWIGTIRADQVSPSWSDRLGRSLSPLRDVSRDDPSSALPSSVRLLDLVSPVDIAERWGRSTRAVIGVGPDGPFEIDISLDGPHALIAGTTGAGKSELLQTLICSLAVANRPDEMTFVLIDYKGGAAFKECVRLPHAVGMVSDLDGHLTQRALASLAAEIRRRERLLLAAGAKDIDDYQRLGEGARNSTWVLGAAGRHAAELTPDSKGDGTHPTMPRLVLIIDEFASLVAELPDFVDGLVDIARRGRSLGIHLVLATQRPGGVVTADIQANTSLRIALRVTDARESADVIDSPEAARISKSTPGRCYVRSGSGAATSVQTARIGGRTPAGRGAARGAAHGGNCGDHSNHGGRADRDRELRVIDLPWEALGHPPSVSTQKTSVGTDLALLVDAIREAAQGIPQQPSPWLPPLPEHVTLASGHVTLPTGHRRPYEPGVEEVPPLPYGVADLPWAQDRRPLMLNPQHSGHLLIAGAARSGRSTALRTIAGSIAAGASPEDVHIHAIDCGSGALLPLVALPHCGAVVTRDQLDRVDRLLSRLRAEVGRRQALLAEAGYASLAEVRVASAGRRRPRTRPAHDRNDPDTTGATGIERLPWLVLMVDRWEGYVAAFENYDYGRLLDSLMQLLREGPAVGLRAVVTADRSGLLGQISTVFEDRLILRLADPADYGLAGLPVKNLPSAMPPGRVLSVGEHGLVEGQIALLAEDPTGPAQVAALQALARTARTRFPGPDDASIPRTGATISPGTGAPDIPGSDSAAFVGTGDANIPGLGSTGTPGRGHMGGAAPGDWGWASPPPLRVDALPMRIMAEQALELTPSFAPPSALWALLGAGGDTLAPMGIDLLAQGPAAVVAGPPRSGRSSCLLTAAKSLLQRGTSVLVVTPRRSPLRDMAGAPGVLAVLDGNARSVADDAATGAVTGGATDGETAAFSGLPGAYDPRTLLLGREQYVVIVDDAELISPESALGLALEEILRTARDGEHGLLIAGTTGDLTTAYRGFAAEARKARTGLLLSVQSPADGDLFSVRLPRGAVGGPQGRGLLVISGTATPIQAAVPT